MKNTLATAVILTILHFGCSSNDKSDKSDDAMAPVSAGGVIATVSGGTSGMATNGTAGSVPTAAAETGTTAGIGGATTDNPCPNGIAEGDLTLDTATKLAAASGCTTVKGSLMILGSDIDNIDALGNLNTVGGSLIIQDALISDVRALDKLTSVGNDLYLFRLVDITNVDGLGALATVGGNLTISGDERLIDLRGLTSLASMGADKILNLRNNPSLPTCEAKQLVEKLGRKMDGTDPNVSVCSTVEDSCGRTELCGGPCLAG